MDFFAHQEAARKKTGILVVLFFLSVILIVLAVYAAIATAMLWMGTDLGKVTGLDRPRGGVQLPAEDPGISSTDILYRLWDPRLFLAVSAGTLIVLLGGSAYKTAALSAGGESVATLLGGRPLNPNTDDPKEKMVLNVVEEMALASGMPVPPVFILDQESGINAFAAGFTTDDAVVGVTRGTVELLTRDEFQGVIAHEFSHILNGDMKLNMRLIGILHGILLIGLIGFFLMRSFSGGRYNRRRSRNNQGSAVALLGLALLVIGYVGVFFAKLIKSAVSRQREFLADAAAVQFTRYPDGIANALKKIGGVATGSRLQSVHAEQASHMFFGNALRTSLFGLLSTHPPLEVRIKRLDPSFDGNFTKVALPRHRPADAAEHDVDPIRSAEASAIRSRVASLAPQSSNERTIPFRPAQAVAEVGTASPDHLRYASALLSVIPEPVQAMAREPFGARAVIYGLLLDENPEVRKAQGAQLQQYADSAVYQATRQMVQFLPRISPEMRLPLIDLALPALRSLSPDQYRVFRETVSRMVKADSRISLFEYVLHRTLLNHLAPHFQRKKRRIIHYYAMRPLLESCTHLLRALAFVGHKDANARQRALAEGVAHLGVSASETSLALGQDGSVSLDAVDRALKELSATSPGIKRRILDACAQCVGADGFINVEEGELLRVIADTLDCPMPPLLAGAQPAMDPVSR